MSTTLFPSDKCCPSRNAIKVFFNLLSFLATSSIFLLSWFLNLKFAIVLNPSIEKNIIIKIVIKYLRIFFLKNNVKYINKTTVKQRKVKRDCNPQILIPKNINNIIRISFEIFEI